MKASYNWIKDYLKIDHDTEALGEILTDIGLEVEGLETVESVKGGLVGIVIGKVIECAKHPDADRLSVTKVDVGLDEPLPIVCGAPNVREGLHVLVATVGTTLYDGEGKPWKIKKGKIRGQESHGMICAEDELGLGSGHDGIMEIDAAARIGQKASEYLEVSTDQVYEIGLTPNRSDATGHLGVAKDLRAYFNFHHDQKIDFAAPELEEINMDSSDSLPIAVEVQNKEACPRYSGIVLSNLKIGPSPKWMADRLNAIGVRPVNNVVDITNYVLHEYGQPLHAFDYQKISHNKVIVTNLDEGTNFLSLDEKERKLDRDDLMICDGDLNPMCIGGVFGGANSGVTDQTTEIFLESAHFEAIGIRRSSTRHLLFTDAAKCFEKGSDPNVTVEALRRAVFLLKKYADAKVSSELIDLYPQPIAEAEITTSISYINRLLGHDFSKETIGQILEAMEMTVSFIDDEVHVKVPTNKADVTRPADLAEEILRIYGMNQIEIENRLNYSFSHHEFGSSYAVKNKVADLLAAQGLNEAMGLSLTNEKLWADQEGLVRINNTSNVHLNIMRPNLLVSMLESVAYNFNRQQDSVRLFEFGRTYRTKDDEYVEKDVLGITLAGEARPENWRDQNREVTFFDMKKLVDQILEAFQIPSQGLSTQESDIMTPCYVMSRGPMEVYRIGEISEEICQKYGIKGKVLAAQIDWENLMRLKKSEIKVSPISKFPQTRRDLALVVDQSVEYDQLAQIAKKQGGAILSTVDLFDIYSNEEQLGEGKKSYALKLIFSNPDRTLKDKEVDQVIQKIVRTADEKLGAKVRQ